MDSNGNIVELLNKFRNEVLCRRDSNQLKASKLWVDLKSLLTKEEVYEINDDWVHYIDDVCRTTDQFGLTLKKITEKYSIK
jgi:hypothetical protein